MGSGVIVSIQELILVFQLELPLKPPKMVSLLIAAGVEIMVIMLLFNTQMAIKPVMLITLNY